MLHPTLPILEAYLRTAKSIQRDFEIFHLYDMFQNLAIDLALGQYSPQHFRCFVVCDPKTREIFAPSFRDRLVHHWVVDRLAPLIDRRLIFDSFANRPQKGLHGATLRLQYMMRQLPSNAYFMKLDIANYFTSINRQKLKSLLVWHLSTLKDLEPGEKLFFTDVIGKICDQNPAHDPILSGNPKMLKQIPTHKSLFHTQNHIGMPIGALTSQFFSNIYLNELDRFVKHDLKVHFYIRYVDDFVLLAKDTRTLIHWKFQIQNFLKTKLDLSLHPQKTQIQPIHRGCDFLGSVVRPHVITVRPRTIKALRRRIYFFNHLLDPIKFPYSKPPLQTFWESQYNAGLLKPPIKPTAGLLHLFGQSINSYFGLMSHAQTFDLRREIYLKDFHLLQYYFLPDNHFKKVKLRPLKLLKRERLIAF